MKHWVTVLCAFAIGCDSPSATEGADASPADADANLVGNVVVHAVDKTGAAVPGLHVVFIDSDGTTIDQVTNAQGTAQASVHPGASATVIRERNTLGAYSMTTVQALVPGDDITIDTAPGSAAATDDAMSNRVVPLNTTAAGNMTFTYPAYSGAAKYIVFTPCGRTDVGTSRSPSLAFQAGCVKSPFDVLVVAASSGDVPLAWATKSGITFAAKATAAITDTWHAPESFAATYTNVTNRVTSIEMNRFVPYVRGIAQQVATGTTTGGDTTISTTKATKGLTTLIKSRILCAEGTGAGCVSSSSGTAQQTINEVIDGNAAAYSLDVGANLLPWVSASYVPETKTIAVTLTGTGTVDLFEANLRYTRNNAVIYTWRVFGPTPGDVTFPTLPATIPGDPTVRSTDAQGVYQVYLCESTALSGYRAAIKNVYESLGTCEANATATGTTATKPLAPTTGMSRLSQWN
ncbi:MAG: hypothetical protein HOV81_30080 [Kofleriaceae bacterium]|nr:hypothetical protein [Kofleriaceae bacterium]